ERFEVHHAQLNKKPEQLKAALVLITIPKSSRRRYCYRYVAPPSIMTGDGRNEAESPVILERNDFHIHGVQRYGDLLEQTEQLWRHGRNLTGLWSELIAFIHLIRRRGAVWPDDGKQQDTLVGRRLQRILDDRTPPTRVNSKHTAAHAGDAVGNFNEVLGCRGKLFDATEDAALLQIQFGVA